MNHYQRMAFHITRLAQNSGNVSSEQLVGHWETISALAQVLADAFSAELKKPKIKITPKETDEDVRLP
jgi:hypothetical protein